MTMVVVAVVHEQALLPGGDVSIPGRMLRASWGRSLRGQDGIQGWCCHLSSWVFLVLWRQTYLDSNPASGIYENIKCLKSLIHSPISRIDPHTLKHHY